MSTKSFITFFSIVYLFLSTFDQLSAEEQSKVSLISNAYRKVIFPQGDGGSKYFRIPALITAKNGDLLAVIDARRNTTRDLQHTRNIDIAFKRSSDNGNTWSDIDFITR